MSFRPSSSSPYRYPVSPHIRDARNAMISQDRAIAGRQLGSGLDGDDFPLSDVSSPSDTSSGFNVKQVIKTVRASPNVFSRAGLSSLGADVSSCGRFDEANDRNAQIKSMDQKYKKASIERDLVRKKLREREKRLDYELNLQRERCEYYNNREFDRLHKTLEERADPDIIGDHSVDLAASEITDIDLRENKKQKAMLEESVRQSDGSASLYCEDPEKELISKDMEHVLHFRRRQIREMDIEFNTVHEDNAELQQQVVALTTKLSKIKRAYVDAEGRFETTQEENVELRADRNRLSNDLHQLRIQNSYLSSLVEEFQHKTPMVVVRNKEPEVVSWTIDESARRFRENLRPKCLFSPPLSSKALQKVEIEFYPNGRGDAPRGHCTVMVRLEKGTRVTLQMFVGTKRTNNLEVMFTANDQGYSEHFADPRSEVDARTDTLTIGIMILKNHTSAKYIIY